MTTTHRRLSRWLLASALATASLVVGPAAVAQAGDGSPGCDRVLMRDRFSSDTSANWTFVNRAGSIHDGALWMDGDYLPGALGRDGWALNHVGAKRWQDYSLTVRYDSSNDGGFPAEAHQTTLYVRVKATGTTGRDTAYRIDVWDPGQPDPSGGGTLTHGSVGISRHRHGVGTVLAEVHDSNTSTGWNTVTVTVIGSKIIVKANGERVLSVTDSLPITYGGVGVGQIWETNGVFGDVKVCAR